MTTRTAARVDLQALRWGADLEAEGAARGVGVELPAGWRLGKPFRCLSVGEIYQRVESPRTGAGERRGQPITREHLEAIVRAFDAGEAIPINLEHRRGESLGTVAAAWLVDGGDALAVLPAYNATLAAVVARCDGALFSSPEIAWSPTHDAATGEHLGEMLMDGLALCSHPAQAHRKIDRVRLAAEGAEHRATPAPEETEMEQEFRDFMAAVLARLAALEEKVNAKPEAEEPAEGEAAAEGATEETEAMAALKAEVAALKADAEKLRAERLSSERAAAVRELLSTGRIAPAEKAAAEAVVDRGGVELLSTVYGQRKPGSAVPQLRGHSQPVEPAEGDTTEWGEANKAVRELMSADSTLTYDAAFSRVLAARERERLSANG